MKKTIVDGVEYTENEIAEARAAFNRLLATWNRRYKLIDGVVVKKEKLLHSVLINNCNVFLPLTQWLRA